MSDHTGSFRDNEKALSENTQEYGDEKKSLGVRKIEILSNQYRLTGKIVVYVCIFLVSYAYGLDGSVRFAFQTTATSSYSSHSLLSTVNVVRAVVGAAAQPVYARLSDIFGRLELLIVSIVLYVVGTIIESQAFDVQRFAGGAILYQLGYTGVILLMELIVADFSFLNWRLVCSFVPALPFIINTWISGNITNDIGLKWSWGIGMWAIIFPVACIPLICVLVHMLYRARKSHEMELLKAEQTDFQRLGWKGFIVHLFWLLDVIGIVLLCAVFGLILVPFTLAGGLTTEWQKAKIIVPLVLGFVCIPVFVAWEMYTTHPVIPLKLLRQKTVVAAVIIAVLINFIWTMEFDYMYSVLIVAVDQSAGSATRITSLYSFVSVITGTILGLLVVRLRYLKPFVVFGTVLWLVSSGMLIRYRGGDTSKAGIIGSICLMGFGAGLFTYPVQVIIQASAKHEHMAVITSLYLASYNIGSALGNSVSGAIWTQTLPGQILKGLGGDEALAEIAYGSPLQFVVSYPWGTPERTAVAAAYQHVQKILAIVATCLSVVLIVTALFLNNPRLDAVQSLPGAEESESESESTTPVKSKWSVRRLF